MGEALQLLLFAVSVCDHLLELITFQYLISCVALYFFHSNLPDQILKFGTLRDWYGYDTLVIIIILLEMQLFYMIQ